MKKQFYLIELERAKAVKETLESYISQYSELSKVFKNILLSEIEKKKKDIEHFSKKLDEL